MEWKSVGIMKFPSEWKIMKLMFQSTNQTVSVRNENTRQFWNPYQGIHYIIKHHQTWLESPRCSMIFPIKKHLHLLGFPQHWVPDNCEILSRVSRDQSHQFPQFGEQPERVSYPEILGKSSWFHDFFGSDRVISMLCMQHVFAGELATDRPQVAGCQHPSCG